MKVREMIKFLEQCPQDFKLIVSNSDFEKNLIASATSESFKEVILLIDIPIDKIKNLYHGMVIDYMKDFEE